VDRQRRKDVFGLRHESEAVPDLLMRRHIGDVDLAERGLAGMNRHQP
jgi:hypothetical protein